MNHEEDQENFADFTPDGIVLMWVQKILDDIQIPDGSLYLDRNSVRVHDAPEADAEYVLFRIGGMSTVNEQLTQTLCAQFGGTDIAWYVEIASGNLMFMWLKGALMKWGYEHWKFQRANPSGNHANVKTGPGFLARLWYNGSIRLGLSLMLISFVMFAVVLNDMNKPEVWHSRDRIWANTIGRVWHGLSRLAAKLWNAIAGETMSIDPKYDDDATWMYSDDGGPDIPPSTGSNGGLHRRTKGGNYRPSSPPPRPKADEYIKGFKTKRSRDTTQDEPKYTNHPVKYVTHKYPTHYAEEEEPRPMSRCQAEL